MASFHTVIPDPDDLCECPYDKAHLIRAKKMPYHLIKCRKNHPTRAMRICDFNARHEVLEAEYRFHLAECPDRHRVERAKPSNDDGEEWIKGNTDVPTYYPDVHIIGGDDWDEELLTPRIGVHSRELAGIGYYKSLNGMKKSQKKAFRENLERGDTEANVELMTNFRVGAAPNDNALTTSPSPTATVPVSSPSSVSGLGRGRGKPRFNQKEFTLPGVSTSATTPSKGYQNEFAGLRISASPSHAHQKQVITQETVPNSTGPVDETDVLKNIRKVKKKLVQIESLVARQADGEVLNEEEILKVGKKSLFLSKLAALERKAAAVSSP